MLEYLTLENFKAFKKLDKLPIKPITILCGTNSCGKSSILQSILLLKQTLESRNPNQNLLLNGRFTQLGYFEDVVYQKKKEHDLGLGFGFNIYKANARARRIFVYNFLMQLFSSRMSLGEHNHLINGEWILNFYINNKQESNFKLPKITYLIEICQKKEPENPVFKAEIKQIEDNKLEINSSLGNKERPAEWWLHQINLVIRTILSDYTYIGPLRGEPEREYIYRDEVVEIGNKGEGAAYLYLEEKDNEIPAHYFYQASTDRFESEEGLTLAESIHRWMSLMKIQNLDAEVVKRIIYLSLNASRYDSTKVGIADVGFGVSQIFPILLEGLRMDKGGTLLLEQPEIHLHPDLQMQMADYFVSLALSEKNVLVETHSDHIIHRLVRRIVEDTEHNLKDKVAIYFIKPSEEGAVCEAIEIDDTKGIVNWPPDFFDQAANEQMRIMQAGLKKRKSLQKPSK